jgi:hypothetical protein
MTALLPAQVLAKAVYLVLGILFWHVIPVIMALSAEDRKRLPPAFNDLPTDADFAMELISKRVAAGLEVNTMQTRRHGRHQHGNRDQRQFSMTSLDTSKDSSVAGVQNRSENNTDWKKWSQRAVTGMQLANDTKRLFTSGSKVRSMFSLQSLNSYEGLRLLRTRVERPKLPGQFQFQHYALPKSRKHMRSLLNTHLRQGS